MFPLQWVEQRVMIAFPKTTYRHKWVNCPHRRRVPQDELFSREKDNSSREVLGAISLPTDVASASRRIKVQLPSVPHPTVKICREKKLVLTALIARIRNPSPTTDNQCSRRHPRQLRVKKKMSFKVLKGNYLEKAPHSFPTTSPRHQSNSMN